MKAFRKLTGRRSQQEYQAIDGGPAPEHGVSSSVATASAMYPSDPIAPPTASASQRQRSGPVVYQQMGGQPVGGYVAPLYAQQQPQMYGMQQQMYGMPMAGRPAQISRQMQPGMQPNSVEQQQWEQEQYEQILRMEAQQQGASGGYRSAQNIQENSEVLQMIRAELQTVAECTEVLSDMCAAVDPESPSDVQAECVLDLVQLCRGLRQHVLEMIDNIGDEGCLNLALTVHDEINRALDLYDFLLGKARAAAAASSPAAIQPSLIDLSITDDLPPQRPAPAAPIVDEAKVKALTRRAAILLEYSAQGGGNRGAALLATAGSPTPAAPAAAASPGAAASGSPALPPRPAPVADLLSGDAPFAPASPPLQVPMSPSFPSPQQQRAPPPPPPQQQQAPAAEWACASCTYAHVGEEAGFLMCGVCGTPRE